MFGLLEFGGAPISEAWIDEAVIRAEVYGADRLEKLAAALASEKGEAASAGPRTALRARLEQDAASLSAANRELEAQTLLPGGMEPAAVRFLDNYHLIEQQVRACSVELWSLKRHRLPTLAEGKMAGQPRLLALLLSYLAHVDSYVEPHALTGFCAAYQMVRPLTIAELRAMPALLRFLLVENARRLVEELIDDRAWRAKADAAADQLLGATDRQGAARDAAAAILGEGPLPDVALAQLVKRLRDQDPQHAVAQGWLDQRIVAGRTSVDEAVHNAYRRHGAGNVTLRNILASMRWLSEFDWAVFASALSVVDDAFRRSSAFGLMDFDTRELYRDAVEDLAQGAGIEEKAVVERINDLLAASGEDAPGAALGPAEKDHGHYLIAEGRPTLERAINYHASLRQAVARAFWRWRRGGYFAASLALCALVLWGMIAFAGFGPVGPLWLSALALLGIFPASEAAVALVNRAVIGIVGPWQLPGLELADGVPEGLRTLVVVPTLLTTAEDLEASIEDLEVHHLSNRSGDLAFALLVDGQDSDDEIIPEEEAIYAAAERQIDLLNKKYGPAPAGFRFMLLRRRRLFNPSQKRWMGWERKRGKLYELNRLLRGARDTSFIQGPDQVPAGVRYVVTLDADTRLPRGSLVRLIGKMSHPLNRPTFDPKTHRVRSGYAILQPRISASIPSPEHATLYQWAFSQPGGIDPYAGAVSDVYQDLFGEGSFTGKGIYDVDAFDAALADRIPENRLLSHDLFEGSLARAGLASSIEFVEDFPSRYDVDVKRQHRWARGDWQLLPFMGDWLAGKSPLTGLAIWKMLDNLRRSLTAPCTVGALALGWTASPISAALWSLAVVVAIALPSLMPAVLAFVPQFGGPPRHSAIRGSIAQLRLAVVNNLLRLAFLADQSYRMLDAVTRTLHRLFVSKRNLLEWVTAAQARASQELDLAGFARSMAGGVGLALVVGVAAAAASPRSLPIIAMFVVAWCASPFVALLVSRRPVASFNPPSADQVRILRAVARKTWRYFETYVTPGENMLPPDNFQETPAPVIAHRTSPTNLGLHLLSAVAARDFGWSGQVEIIDRLERSLEAMSRLKRHRGHFYNWYDTTHMQVLAPAYVSTVDSGNLAGNLIALANVCREWQGGFAAPEEIKNGLRDTLALAREALVGPAAYDPQFGRRVQGALDEIAAHLDDEADLPWTLASIFPLSQRAVVQTGQFAGGGPGKDQAELLYWLQAFSRSVAAHRADAAADLGAMKARLATLERTVREMANAMEFDFLLEPQRNLLSIGFNVTDNRLDGSCYDLLASEARVACMFAVAKGDVHSMLWSRLGRRPVEVDGGIALLSWSGSMFEYLMPSLLMRDPVNSLMHQCNRSIVARQRSYARKLAIPWGISESAFNARDLQQNYQYQAFGVPDLAMKRGLASEAVIAPYATALAAMVDARAAAENCTALAKLGFLGRYGFYEAIDFTRARLPEDTDHILIRNYMAHHQGMSIVAISNALHQGKMRERFHAEPMIKACELLLHEPAAYDAVRGTFAEGVRVVPTRQEPGAAIERRFGPPTETSPQAHVLSNGTFATMLTSAGSGYTRWKNVAVTRWRQDATRDNWGSFIFARDVTRGRSDGLTWSTTYQPALARPKSYEATFSEDRAEFKRTDGAITTTVEIVVSAAANAEVRRVTLSNAEREIREIELTSYAELVLAPAATDDAHQAFAKMFVETELHADHHAALATRRRRSQEDPEVWAAHFAVVEGRASAPVSFETDRARFLGRGRSVEDAVAMAASGPLSNTFGTVIDPVFALRQRVLVPRLGSVRVAFWTMVAATRDELLAQVEARLDPDGYNRDRIHAWTQAQVVLRHLSVSPEEAVHFQALASAVLYGDPRLRSSSETILKGAGPQSGLWRFGVSGDNPIVLLRIDDMEDFDVVGQMLRAHEFLREKLLAADLVILNERTSSYVQDLQNAIEAAARSVPSTRREGALAGAIYALRTDVIGEDGRALLLATARVVLVARRGDLAQQLVRLGYFPAPLAALPAVAALSAPIEVAARAFAPTSGSAPKGLEFFNGVGGFDDDGREYVVSLDAGRTTPAPWVNVIANARFGFQVSADGAGYTWCGNSRDHQLTPWSNDPVSDPPGEALYLRDLDTGEVWSPTASPIRDDGLYVARHGFGYSSFQHGAHGIDAELAQFAPLDMTAKVLRLSLANRSQRVRRISVTLYAEWTLGGQRAANAPFIVSELDAPTKALFASNKWGAAGDAVAFMDLFGKQTAWTADRREFIGRNGSLRNPAAIRLGSPLSGRTGGGLDPCGALQCVVEIPPGGAVQVDLAIGEAEDADKARALIESLRQLNVESALNDVKAFWRGLLGAVHVRTPDRAMDIMLNGWLMYQTIACRIMARSAFYQASGAYGFRDQLQDHMALTFNRPDLAREHLKRAVSRQFVEGDVQHWWLPQSGQGVRTKISDDRVWLVYCAAVYVEATGDVALLDEPVPFLEGRRGARGRGGRVL